MTINGGKPHSNVGEYSGQRYEVSVFDCYKNERVVIGWSDDNEVASRMASSAELRPSWKFAHVTDLRATDA